MREFDIKRLTEASLNISTITCECKVWMSRHNHRTAGLVVFRGLYHPGSAGKDDARFIRWKLEEFYELYRVDGLGLDCRDLKYTWGDDLDFPGRVPDRADHFPLVVVLLPDQQEAYEYAIPREMFRDDLIGALGEVDEAIRALRSLL